MIKQGIAVLLTTSMLIGGIHIPTIDELIGPILEEYNTKVEEIQKEKEEEETRPEYVVTIDPNNPLNIPSCTDERVKEWNPVIIDLDFFSDVDDIMSLRMLAELDNLGYCDVKAAGMCINGFEREVHNTLAYSGLYDVPIGKSSMYVEADEYNIMGPYTTAYNCDDSLVIKDAVTLYKEVLRESKRPVKIITTGYLTNIQLLLQDPEGYELVKNNCEGLYIVGGSYPSGMDNNFFYTKEATPAIKYVLNNSPTTLYIVTNLSLGTRSDTGLFPGFGGVMCGKWLYLNDVAQYDIVTKALQSYMDFYGVSADKPAGDPMGVWFAVMPDGVRRCHFEDCNMYIADNGCTTFDESLPANCKVGWLDDYSAGQGAYYGRRIDWLLTRAVSRKYPNITMDFNY